ncbi:hypothetical protein BGZ91_001257 [Linnemannia elongata]|nr:hypothetical protein BGZ91_001257 [Linnemannia elongata]
MGNSASKSNATAKSAARHFPSAKSAMQEKAAAAAAAAAAATKMNATAASTAFKERGAGGVGGSSSPKQDYLEQQRRLEEEIARYDEEIKKSGKLDGESRPLEDTPSAAEMQFFGNLNTIGQVDVANPDQVKHREAEAILKRKLPSKTPSSSSSYSSGSNNTSTPKPPPQPLQQLHNPDPTIWTEDVLAHEFGLKKQDLRSLTQYINTYSILPGKDAKGREAGVWCEDLRGVEVLDKPSSIADAEAEAGIEQKKGVKGQGKGRTSLLSDSLSADETVAAGKGGARQASTHGGRK